MSTIHEAFDEVKRLSALLDRSLQTLRKAGQDHAGHEYAYRKARGQAWAVTAGRGLVVAEREAMVDEMTAEHRRDRDNAASLEKSALEAVRSRRQQLSALQSLMAGMREEAAFMRTGPG